MVPSGFVDTVDSTSSLGHTSDHPNGEDTHNYKTTYSTPFTSGILVASMVGYILYRINHYVSEGNEVHPLTSMLDKHINYIQSFQKEDYGVEYVPILQKKANDTLILFERRHIRDPIRLTNLDAFSKSSNRNLHPCDLKDYSDVKIRHSWEIEKELTPEKVFK